MSRRLSPIDIQHADFPRTVGGYDRKEVRAFLERLSLEVEAALREAQGLRQQLAAAEAEAAELRAAEAELQRAVMAAERIATDLKENARREAQLLLVEADRQSRERLLGAEEGMHRARADLSRLERERALFKEQFRGLLQAYLRGLDADDAIAPPPRAGAAARDGAQRPGEEPPTRREPPARQEEFRDREEEPATSALLDDSVQP